MAGGVATALAVLSFSPAGAQQQTNSFSGSCDFPGTAFFDPPATNTKPQDLNVRFTADGTCSGTLNGRTVSNVEIKVLHTAVSKQSTCNEAHARDGHGAITFPDGTVLRYRTDFDSMGTEVDLRFRGEISGTGTGHGTFLTPRTSPAVLLECSSEEGVESTPLDITLETDSPFVSARDAGGDGGDGGGDGDAGDGDGGGGSGDDGARKPRRHLRLKVRPRRARTGKRTVFKFRVTTNKGRVKTGAKVRFAGRTVRTRRGKARIVARFRRPGMRMARASRPGYRSAKRAVRVRRGAPTYAGKR